MTQLAGGATDSTEIAWVDTTRAWLARFPLSILLLAGRIGVGATFFKAGLLKYNSFEFAVKLFQEEHGVPLLDPAVAARMAMVQELTIPILPFLGLATRMATIPLLGTIAVIQAFVYPKRVQRSSGVGLNSRAGVDARPRCIFTRARDYAGRAPTSSDRLIIGTGSSKWLTARRRVDYRS